MSKSKRDLFVGIDLGGTKILAGVFDEDLKIISRAKKSTKAKQGVEGVIDRIAACANEAVEEAKLEWEEISGIGIGAPSPIDTKTGVVLSAPNLGWTNIPLKEELEKRLKVPVAVENDCNLCTLGVQQCELGGKPKNVMGIFVGTGIGGGLILNGELFEGRHCTAGEVGHMVVMIDGPLLEDNIPGSLEAIASRKAMARRLQAGVENGRKSVIGDILKESERSYSEMKSSDLRKAFEAGDEWTIDILTQASKAVGIAAGSIINLLTPDVIVIGGGVVEQLDKFMMPIIETKAREHAFDTMDKGVDIFATKLGDDAGISGGGALARKLFGGKE